MATDGAHAGDALRRPGGEFVAAVLDAHGVVTGWSPDAQRHLGYAPHEVVGRAASTLLAEDLPEEFGHCLTEATPWSHEVALRHLDGRHMRLLVRLVPLLDGSGRCQWIVMTGAPDSFLDEVADHSTVYWAWKQAALASAIYDGSQRFWHVNDSAARILGATPAELRGRHVSEVVGDSPASHELAERMAQVVATDEPVTYRIMYAGTENYEHAWDVAASPVHDPSGQVCGVFTAGIDSSEEYWARQRLALVSEAGTRIGTTLDVVQTAREMTDMLVPGVADFVSVDLLDSVLHGEEPVPSPPAGTAELRRVVHRSLLAGQPRTLLGQGGVRAYSDSSPIARCLAAGKPTISGREEEGFTRWASELASADVLAVDPEYHSMLAVPLRARGITLGVTVFLRGKHPHPFARDDLVLAEELASRSAIAVDNARRYTSERTNALALQRSLLPRRLPEQSAVEVATRYRPAGGTSALGGDWFDVIPLSGARVALVVGDIVGHGLEATATMGRLRTAVRTLADIDLPPDELLTYLDDLVIRLSAEAKLDEHGQPAQEIIATVLYAVYDPISRRCSFARAGHLPPAVVTRDGVVYFPPVPAGPPLGLGGLPFETTELDIPEGSLLALYTDGLVESRETDIETGLENLRAALSLPALNVEGVCDNVLKKLLPERPADDLALLIARTRALHADQVAEWDIPGVPEAVGEARAEASRQLASWGLDDLRPVAELVVTELVTNALRHADVPIRMLLIKDRTLICEVSDASNTAPHMRRARTNDEGGRGLFLVAQMAQRWGVRHTQTGKTIWAELALHEGEAALHGAC